MPSMGQLCPCVDTEKYVLADYAADLLAVNVGSVCRESRGRVSKASQERMRLHHLLRGNAAGQHAAGFELQRWSAATKLCAGFDPLHPAGCLLMCCALGMQLSNSAAPVVHLRGRTCS
jgi:hypothetical protein